MQNLEDMEKDSIFYTKEDYDKVPVHYCKHCLSLKVIILDENTDYCDECGNTEIEETNISNWEDMYINKYKKSFIKKYGREEKNDLRRARECGSSIK